MTKRHPVVLHGIKTAMTKVHYGHGTFGNAECPCGYEGHEGHDGLLFHYTHCPAAKAPLVGKITQRKENK